MSQGTGSGVRRYRPRPANNPAINRMEGIAQFLDQHNDGLRALITQTMEEAIAKGMRDHQTERATPTKCLERVIGTMHVVMGEIQLQFSEAWIDSMSAPDYQAGYGTGFQPTNYEPPSVDSEIPEAAANTHMRPNVAPAQSPRNMMPSSFGVFSGAHNKVQLTSRPGSSGHGGSLPSTFKHKPDPGADDPLYQKAGGSEDQDSLMAGALEGDKAQYDRPSGYRRFNLSGK
ncbi:MAG: hypothetical protein Q9164_006971 [Protoblastenia rupestris]